MYRLVLVYLLLYLGGQVLADLHNCIELIEERTQTAKVLQCAHGERVLVGFHHPIHYPSSTDSSNIDMIISNPHSPNHNSPSLFSHISTPSSLPKWVPIDNTLKVNDARKVIHSASNDWMVEFHNLSTGITVIRAGLSVTWRPILSQHEISHGVTPEIEEDGTSVRYRNAWPYADLIYKVTEIGIEELIEVFHPNASATYEFEIFGDGLTTDISGKLYAFATSGQHTGTFHEPYVVDTPRLSNANTQAKPSLEMNVSEMELGNAVEIISSSVLSVDKLWLSSLPMASFPVVIDPTLTLSPSFAASYQYSPNGVTETIVSLNWVLIGSVTGSASYSRGVVYFDYSPVIRWNVTAVSMRLIMGFRGGGQCGLKVYWAGPDKQPVGGLSQYYASLHDITHDVTIHNPKLTALYNSWAATSSRNNSLLLIGNENSTYAARSFQLTITITYNATCTNPCSHGACTAPNYCNCTGTGYWGSRCQFPICNPPCQYGGACIAPDTCNCPYGFYGMQCQFINWTGIEANCGNGVVDPLEQCDGGPCCSSKCSFLPYSASCGPTCSEGICSGDSVNCTIPSEVYPLPDACGVCGGDNSTCLSGCDHQPHSTLVYDACHVCGGDNSTCLSGCDHSPNSILEYDACGVCGGDNHTCLSGCDNQPHSNKTYDVCGVCGGDNACVGGCDMKPFSTKVYDACGVCGGRNQTCASGCDRKPYSNKTFDVCGVCGGDNTSCITGCDQTPNSKLSYDACGVCGGDNSTCLSGCDNQPKSTKRYDLCGVCGGNDTTCNLSRCGDGVCNSEASENCLSCPKDCGICNFPSCPGEPPCNGFGNCSFGSCICDDEHIGPACEYTPTPTNATHTRHTTMVTFYTASGSPYPEELVFEIGVKEICEIDGVTNQRISSVRVNDSLSIQHVNKSHSPLSYDMVVYGIFANGALLQINVSLFTQSTEVEFADIVVNVGPYSLKYTFTLSNWPFKSPVNRLNITLQSVSNKSSTTVEPPPSNHTQQDADGNLIYFLVKGKTQSLYGQIIPIVIHDGMRRSVASSYIHDSQDVVFVIPHFRNHVVVDPVYSVLLDSPLNEGSIVKLNPSIIEQLPVPLLVGVALAIVSSAIIVFAILVIYPKLSNFLRRRGSTRNPTEAPNNLSRNGIEL